MFFDTFYILKHKIKEKKTQVSLRYPSKEIDEEYKRIIPFCFTDLDFLIQENQKSVMTFMFTLTDVNLKRTYGVCRRVFLNSKTDIECFIFLNKQPLFKLFSLLLSILELRSKSYKGAVIHFLKSLWKSPIPEHSKSLNLLVSSVPKLLPQAEFHFQRPDTLLDDCDSDLLFMLLDSSAIVCLVASVLFEKKIIFTSKSLHTLTNCIQATVALIHPFSWPHILIPVVPFSLLPTVNAPVPYILGLHSSLLVHLEEMELEDLVFCDLDNNRLEFDPVDITIISFGARKLIKTIKKQKATLKKRSVLSTKVVGNEFLDFFCNIFSDFQNYMTINENTKTCEFNFEYFVSQKDSSGVRKFLKEFYNTQLFRSYIQKEEELTRQSYFEKKKPEIFYDTPYKRRLKELNPKLNESDFFCGQVISQEQSYIPRETSQENIISVKNENSTPTMESEKNSNVTKTKTPKSRSDRYHNKRDRPNLSELKIDNTNSKNNNTNNNTTQKKTTSSVIKKKEEKYPETIKIEEKIESKTIEDEDEETKLLMEIGKVIPSNPRYNRKSTLQRSEIGGLPKFKEEHNFRSDKRMKIIQKFEAITRKVEEEKKKYNETMRKNKYLKGGWSREVKKGNWNRSNNLGRGRGNTGNRQTGTGRSREIGYSNTLRKF
ncbi:denn domain-containing [Anaeramoeba flamelloides]|uniref:Denn domain-containing n=1 Tax=Anaeramoeba flamelloides TaxID=1746091 RepID=A0ABQ8Y7I7_9EUKA|nr:denn domain-containing [Anaeramoeba flamelloides]